MKQISNKGKVNRFKYLLYFYVLFAVFIFVYKYIIRPDMPSLILLVAFAPIFGFLSSLVNWPLYVTAMETEGGIAISTRKLFSKKENSILVTKYNFDSYYETDHLHIGMNLLDKDDKLQKHKLRISWLRIKDLRALEEKLREINPYAPVKE
ncbi:hypothetical protein [Roseivirga sp.]|uniref:hypothetical protein n=1 Tax=Roseivirga sp. TaxID=1964215 RepID=UPI002B274597|nr:hypothetical protein [Roseivirga sp.]